MTSFLLLTAVCTLLTNAVDVTTAVHRLVRGVPFELTGTISPYVPTHACFLLTDGSGTTRIEYHTDEDTSYLQCGDVVRISGTINPEITGISLAVCTRLDVISRVPPPPTVQTTIADVKNGRYDNLPVCVRGTIREAFRDDIDPYWYYLVLTDGDRSIYLTLHSDCAELPKVQRLTGAVVSVSGLCTPWDYGCRLTLGRLISLQSFESIRVLRDAPADPFDVPEVVTIRFPNPEDIPPLERRRLSGKVIAIWHGNRLLVRDREGNPHTVELASNPPPDCGTTIEAAGLLSTDLYRMNLTDAIWRDTTLPTVPDPPVEDIANLRTDERGEQRILPTLHGRTFRIRGLVQDRPSEGTQQNLLVLKCGDETVVVDVSPHRSALAGVSVGSTVEATGACVVECENWRSYSAFPHVTGVKLVIRQPADIRILASPPWWTPGRLLTAIGILVGVLIAFLAWNRTLHRVVEKRGRQLFREQVARVSSELRIGERTRLAIELHDSLAQNLTGVSLEIDTAMKMMDEDSPATRKHLGIAAQSLKSCRDELRNCLWDLRNRALETRTMDEAIRQTLAPHLAGVAVAVRFNVPRERISDNTAHAILRIIRELTLNAIRHGGATKVWIAGSIEGGRMHFSVRDNGRGFDPDSAPGFGEGHYGLLGIQERIDEFEGEFTLRSSPGKGTRATVSINVPQEA